MFGMADAASSVAVYSFARYLEGGDMDLLLQRSCKVFAHETGHLLGFRVRHHWRWRWCCHIFVTRLTHTQSWLGWCLLQHCIYFDCLMNGTNHLDEFDSKVRCCDNVVAAAFSHTLSCSL